MSTISQPIKKLLFNSLTAADFGVYTDSVRAAKMLVVKGKGIEIPAAATYTKTCTDPGQLKGTLIELTGDCPCSECNFEYGIRLERKVQYPGQMNDAYWPDTKLFGGSMSSVDCVGGVIEDDDLEKMEGNIIEQIANYNGNYPQQGYRAGAIAEARRYYVATFNGANDDAILVYNSSGIAVGPAIVMDNSGTIETATAVFNADATVSDLVVAYPISSTEVMFISKDNGDLFTIADGGGTTAITIDRRGIHLKAKYADTQFIVSYEAGFAAQYNLWHYILTGCDNATGGTDVAVISGLSHNITTSSTESTYVANINTQIETHGGFASLILAGSTSIQVLATEFENVTSFTYAINATDLAAGVGYGDVVTPSGKWSYLTSDDVMREIGQADHFGELTGLHRAGTETIAGAEYCRYDFTDATQNVDALSDGAGHRNGFTYSLQIYILKSLLATDLWDATNYMWQSGDTGFTADKTFDELITAWQS